MANDGNNVEPTPQIEDIPSPQISGDQGGQSLSQASGSAVDLSAIKEELREEMRREMQSMKDSRLGTYGTRLDSIEDTLAKYAATTGTQLDQKAVDKIVADQKVADLIQKVESMGQAPAQPSAGTGGESVVERRAKLFEASAISASDRRHLDFLRDNKFPSNEAYLQALGDKILEWEQADASKPAPSSGTVAQTVPSVPAGDGSYTKEKYTQDMLAARGKPDEVKRIKAAARADGVDVDNIGFT